MSRPTLRVLSDANVLLRFLLDDHPELSPRAVAVFERAARGEWELLIPTVILAECVYTLRSFYKLERTEVARSLTALLALPGVTAAENGVVQGALRLFAERNVDFADAYLAALSAKSGLPVVSFDLDFGKLGVERLG